MTTNTFFALTVASLIAASSHADTINVPGDFPTIQAAIDASSDGDEIAVAPGIYGSSADNVVDMKERAVRLYATGEQTSPSSTAWTWRHCLPTGAVGEQTKRQGHDSKTCVGRV